MDMDIRTDKDAAAFIRSLGLTVAKYDGEWRIDYPRTRRSQDSAYFTMDREDAIETAKRMAQLYG